MYGRKGCSTTFQSSRIKAITHPLWLREQWHFRAISQTRATTDDDQFERLFPGTDRESFRNVGVDGSIMIANAQPLQEVGHL